MAVCPVGLRRSLHHNAIEHVNGLEHDGDRGVAASPAGPHLQLGCVMVVPSCYRIVQADDP
jgi:hypothetical protein